MSNQEEQNNIENALETSRTRDNEAEQQQQTDLLRQMAAAAVEDLDGDPPNDDSFLAQRERKEMNMTTKWCMQARVSPGGNQALNMGTLVQAMRALPDLVFKTSRAAIHALEPIQPVVDSLSILRAVHHLLSQH
jgi:hypothetical protein